MKRKSFDWEVIGREYRAGQLSIREIARQYGCSDKAIRNKAKKEAWKRDLAKAIKEKVRTKLVRSEVRTLNADKEVTDEEIVEQFSDRAVAVLDLQRKDIGELAAVGQSLREELKTLTCNKEDFEQLAEALMSLDEKKSEGILGLKARLEAIRKVLSLPERVKVYQSLCNSISRLVPLERQAFGFDDDSPGDGILEDLSEILKSVAGATRGLPNRTQTKIEN